AAREDDDVSLAEALRSEARWNCVERADREIERAAVQLGARRFPGRDARSSVSGRYELTEAEVHPGRFLTQTGEEREEEGGRGSIRSAEGEFPGGGARVERRGGREDAPGSGEDLRHRSGELQRPGSRDHAPPRPQAH